MDFSNLETSKSHRLIKPHSYYTYTFRTTIFKNFSFHFLYSSTLLTCTYQAHTHVWTLNTVFYRINFYLLVFACTGRFPSFAAQFACSICYLYELYLLYAWNRKKKWQTCGMEWQYVCSKMCFKSDINWIKTVRAINLFQLLKLIK